MPPTEELPRFDLDGLTGAQIDALASIPQRHIWHGSDFDADTLRVAADDVAAHGVCVMPDGDGGLMVVGPRKGDAEAEAAVRAARRESAALPDQGHVAAWARIGADRRRRAWWLIRLADRARCVVGLALTPPLRPRAREHRARRARARSSRGSPSGDPDEPAPPIGGTS